MKTQTRILDNRLYYTRKIELHRKGKKSRTGRITPILICLYFFVISTKKAQGLDLLWGKGKGPVMREL